MKLPFVILALSLSVVASAQQAPVGQAIQYSTPDAVTASGITGTVTTSSAIATSTLMKMENIVFSKDGNSAIAIMTPEDAQKLADARDTLAKAQGNLDETERTLEEAYLPDAWAHMVSNLNFEFTGDFVVMTRQ